MTLFTTGRVLLTLLSAASVISAQAPLVNPEAPRSTPAAQAAAMEARLEYRPGVPVLSQVVRTLRNSPAASAEAKEQADKLVADATASQRAGNNGEARRSLFHAIALLRNTAWTNQEEFNDSLVLRPNEVVADASSPFILQLTQSFAAHSIVGGGLRVHLSLAEATPSTALDVVKPAGKTIAEIGTFSVPARDLVEDPYRVSADLSSVPDGMFVVVADLSDSEKSLGRIVAPVHLVSGLNTDYVQLQKRLSVIQGHESAKATVLYPFDLARGINIGQREVLAYNFPREVAASLQLAKQLEAGNDPLFRAKGDHHRNYFFTAAHEIMPYRVYVPSKWDLHAKLPMIVALHGSNLDENNFLERANGEMKKLAEERGYIVVTPLGYRINGAYGNVRMAGTDGEHVAELSEKDVLNVMEQVAEEYQVDRSRIYLMGNSMGGMGTYHIGAKFPERFAALAPCAAGLTLPNTPDVTDYPFDRLKGMPLLTVVGELDGLRAGVLSTVKQLKEHGLDPVFIDIKGGTHGTAVEIAMPQIFDFFDQHHKENRLVSGRQ